MPTAYYECPHCHRRFRTRYQDGKLPYPGAPGIQCSGPTLATPHAPVWMIHRGDGWAGRNRRHRTNRKGKSR